MTTMTSLTENEVRRRLTLYEDPEVTDELYDFGKYLVDEMTDRIGKLDSKAASIAAYAIGIVTLLVSTSSNWSGLGKSFPAYGAMIAFLAAVLAARALTLRKFDWFSQDEWLNSDCLSSRERLRKYRLLTIWGVLESHRRVAANKVDWITAAQWTLVIAAVFLVVSLLSVIRVV